MQRLQESNHPSKQENLFDSWQKSSHLLLQVGDKEDESSFLLIPFFLKVPLWFLHLQEAFVMNCFFTRYWSRMKPLEASSSSPKLFSVCCFFLVSRSCSLFRSLLQYPSHSSSNLTHSSIDCLLSFPSIWLLLSFSSNSKSCILWLREENGRKRGKEGEKLTLV